MHLACYYMWASRVLMSENIQHSFNVHVKKHKEHEVVLTHSVNPGSYLLCI